ncbi:MAG: hypothetical protein RL131_406 [Bacteroidota bacterium]|jgi:putative endonuclease
MAWHNDTGKLGEQMAFEWLEQQGYCILEKNWKYGKYEIDIICVRDKKLHCIEVKTRRNTRFGYPEELVDRNKLYHFITAGTAYKRTKPQFKWIRFDILAITLDKTNPPRFYLIEDVYL